MLKFTKNLSLPAPSLMLVAMLSQAGMALGGITPLQQETTISARTQLASVPQPEGTSSSIVFDQFNTGAVAVPIVDLAPAPNQAAAPASVPLPPALETGLSGGVALMLAAGLRRFRRFIRRPL